MPSFLDRKPAGKASQPLHAQPLHPQLESQLHGGLGGWKTLTLLPSSCCASRFQTRIKNHFLIQEKVKQIKLGLPAIVATDVLIFLDSSGYSALSFWIPFINKVNHLWGNTGSEKAGDFTASLPCSHSVSGIKSMHTWCK